MTERMLRLVEKIESMRLSYEFTFVTDKNTDRTAEVSCTQAFYLHNLCLNVLCCEGETIWLSSIIHGFVICMKLRDTI